MASFYFFLFLAIYDFIISNDLLSEIFNLENQIDSLFKILDNVSGRVFFVVSVEACLVCRVEHARPHKNCYPAYAISSSYVWFWVVTNHVDVWYFYGAFGGYSPQLFFNEAEIHCMGLSKLFYDKIFSSFFFVNWL